MNPLTLRPLSLDLLPAELATQLRHLPGFVFFDSAKAGPDSYSILAARPCKILRGHKDEDWALLEAEIAARAKTPRHPFGMPCGITAGWVDYDGSFTFGFYEETLLHHHASAQWFATGDLPTHCTGTIAAHCERPHFIHTVGARQFTGMVRRAQSYIAAGDIYQVNLSHRMEAAWSGDPWRFYESLRRHSPAPHAAFLDLDGRAVLSSSPESFLKMSGSVIRTRPIKGTRPRRATLQADEQSARDLLESPKEAAELLMITDLERNDLGQVCEFGSIRVPELLKLERHAQVFHLVSTVEGRLRTGITQLAALRACFPGGSITGAPKRRAREIIAELEPSPRGLYTGALGWIGWNEESQFSIAIRTVLIEHGRAHFHVGAGIVADSVPDWEWQETLDKAAGILLAAEHLG